MRIIKIYWTGNAKNIIGSKVRALRMERHLTQAALAEQMQLLGIDCTDLTILRIESGKRFVPDYEIKALAKILQVSYEYLLDD